MLSTYLVEYPWATTVALMGLIAFGPIVAAWLAPRPQFMRALLGLAILAVALLTFVPSGREVAIGCVIEWDLPKFRAVEHMANVVMFAPVVLLGGVSTRRPVAVFFLASGASLLIETIQAFVTVLGRSCSTNDWLFNTIGALLGAVLAAAALRLARVTGRQRRETCVA